MPQIELTATMEDYLEAILALEGEKRVARVKDIAGRLQVKMPSVSGALKALKARGLVDHEAYGYVTLTPPGRKLAHQVHDRHRAILDFLGSILQIPAAEAEVEACGLEHALGPEALKRLLALTRFLHEHPGLYQEWLDHLHVGPHEPHPHAPDAFPAPAHAATRTLDSIPPGVTVRLLKVGGAGAIRRRLLDMGLRPGAELRVARIAPLGDPVEVHLLDYHLSLRKVEAAGIEVEIVAMPLTAARVGERVIVEDALGCGILEQLRPQGLQLGTMLTVAQAAGPTGGMMVQVEGQDLLLGRGQAHRLLVRPAPTT